MITARVGYKKDTTTTKTTTTTLTATKPKATTTKNPKTNHMVKNFNGAVTPYTVSRRLQKEEEEEGEEKEEEEEEKEKTVMRTARRQLYPVTPAT